MLGRLCATGLFVLRRLGERAEPDSLNEGSRVLTRCGRDLLWGILGCMASPLIVTEHATTAYESALNALLVLVGMRECRTLDSGSASSGCILKIASAELRSNIS